MEHHVILKTKGLWVRNKCISFRDSKTINIDKKKSTK